MKTVEIKRNKGGKHGTGSLKMVQTKGKYGEKILRKTRNETWNNQEK